MYENSVIPADVKKHLLGLLEKAEKSLYIHKPWCKQCGLCVAFCPQGALKIGKDGFPEVDEEKCVRCMMCENRCPDMAITLLQGR